MAPAAREMIPDATRESRGAWRRELVDVLHLGAGTAVTALLGFGFILLAARRLPPAEFATLGSALAVLYLATVFATPTTAAVARLFAEAAASGRGGGLRALLRLSLTRSATLATLLVLASWAAGSFLARLSGWNDRRAVIATAIAIGAIVVLAPIRGALRGLDRFSDLNRSTILEAALRCALGAALFTVVATAHAALSAYALAAAFSSIAASRALALPAAVPQVDLGAGLRGATVELFAAQLLVAGYHNVDMIFVRKLASTEEAAFYAGAVSIARILGFLYLPFSILVVPRVAVAAGSGRSPLAPAIRLAALFAAIALPIAALFIAIPDRVAGLVLGPGFEGSGRLLARLGPAFLVGGINALLAQALAVRARTRSLLPFSIPLVGLGVALALGPGSTLDIADRVLAAHLCGLAGLGLVVWRARAVR